MANLNTHLVVKYKSKEDVNQVPTPWVKTKSGRGYKPDLQHEEVRKKSNFEIATNKLIN